MFLDSNQIQQSKHRIGLLLFLLEKISRLAFLVLGREAATSNVVCLLHLMPSIADLADGDGPPCTENALLVSLRFVWKEVKVF